MLQATVKKTLPIGSAGEIYRGALNFGGTSSKVAISDVNVGEFVQAGTLENEVTQASGVAITAKILGVVVKDKLVNACTFPTVKIAEGDNCSVTEAGYVFINTSAIATQGQYVYLKTADGTLAFATAATLADHTNTGWIVDIGNATATAGTIGITTVGAK